MTEGVKQRAFVLATLVCALPMTGCGRLSYDAVSADAALDAAAPMDGSVDESFPADARMMDGAEGGADATFDADLDAGSDGGAAMPGVVLSPMSGLRTSEMGGTATFSVVLASLPESDVSISVHSTNEAEGIAAPSSLIFTPTNWFIAQPVTLTGVDDLVADGEQAYAVLVDVETTEDAAYLALPAQIVAASNTDDESAGIVVTPTAGLVTTEAGGTSSFTVVLTSRPTATVSVAVASDMPSEGVASPASLDFDESSWDIPQTVLVTGVDDFGVDGDKSYTIVTSAASSADLNYNGINPADVAVSNLDDDAVGIVVSPTAGLFTSEAGGIASFTIVLASSPSANVSVSFVSSDTSEGTVLPPAVTFTSANWNVARTITVTGVDDALVDGDIAYVVDTSSATSSDPAYSGLEPENVSVTNADNEVPSVVVTPTSGLITTEAGTTATFSVTLSAQPASDVMLTLTSSNLFEGTVSPASVTLTNSTWNIAHVVTITGVDDAVDDGDQSYSIVTSATVSTDAPFDGLSVVDVSATNLNDDLAGVSVMPTSGLSTSEAGSSAMFSVVLLTQPASDVVISLVSDDLTEGTVAPASMTFTSANWSVAQTATVTGVNEMLVDGTVSYSVLTDATSADSLYNGISVSDVSINNTDNDIAGVTVTPTGGIVTTEAGGTATFTLVLSAQPAADVSISLASNDLTEGTVSPASVTFTNANWNMAQTVTVTGVDDTIVDGHVAFFIITSNTSSLSSPYNGILVSDVGVSNVNNDTPTNIRVSIGTPFAQGDADAYSVAMSGDGRYVAFQSAATNLVVGDTNSRTDVFVHDTMTSTTTRVTLMGVQGIGDTYVGGISLDGRYIVVSSTATNFVVGDTNGFADALVYDRVLGTFTRVSVDSGGTQGNGQSGGVTISDDNRYVLFTSNSTNLVAGDTNGAADCFAYDRMTAAVTRIGLANGGSELNGYCTSGGISADNRYFVFSSNAANAVAGDTNGVADVFLRDLMTGTVTRVSTDASGTQGTAGSYLSPSSLSSDGRYVAFMSDAPNLVPGDTNACSDGFVRDTLTGSIVRATVNSLGAQGNANSFTIAISRDGSTVAFVSAASNFFDGDNNSARDAFARHLATGSTLPLSLSTAGGSSAGATNSSSVSLSATGTYAAYDSTNSFLVAGDTNGFTDAYRVTLLP